MATGSVKRNANGIANRAIGMATGDGTALSVAMGFRPISLVIHNVTDGTSIEKLDTMTDAQSIFVAADGARTLNMQSAIVFTDRGFVTSAAVNANAKALHWHAN